jgi:LmbE family N-acetylglucosaminyl deacetylase
MSRKLTILAVGAHMDDVENGVGGILIQAVAAGHRVVAVVTVSDYSTWENTIGREDDCKRQQLALAAEFGYEKRFLDYPYHQFMADVEAKQKLAAIYDELQADITFVHTTGDYFPDHVNTGIAAHDAVLFAHGLTETRQMRRCPRVLAFNVTPNQTRRFEPDFFVDVTDVMPQYMALLRGTDLCLGTPAEELIHWELKDLDLGYDLQLSGHGWRRLIQCAAWGDRNKVRYAIGLETLYGPQLGQLWC